MIVMPYYAHGWDTIIAFDENRVRLVKTLL
jgi:hypothetical protein